MYTFIQWRQIKHVLYIWVISNKVYNLSWKFLHVLKSLKEAKYKDRHEIFYAG